MVDGNQHIMQQKSVCERLVINVQQVKDTCNIVRHIIINKGLLGEREQGLPVVTGDV